MNYEIVELSRFSGPEATFYSIIPQGERDTLFETFLKEYAAINRKEMVYLANHIKIMAKSTGARDSFFKLGEGKPGDGVCALYDDPDKKFRLFCIRYGAAAVIICGGAPKPKNIQRWQDDKMLTIHAELAIQISKDITERLRAGDLEWSAGGSQLLGNLIFSDDKD